MSKAFKNKVKLNDIVSVTDFGAVGDGVTDDTAAIQAALDYAYTNRKLRVQFGSGTYIASTLTLYSGLSLVGEYQGSFGLGNEYGADYVGTVLKQKTGTNAHFLRFSPLAGSDGNDRIGPFHMQGFVLVGDGSASSGDGLRFQGSAQFGASKNSTATRPTICQSLTVLRDLHVRNFKGNGIWLPACHGGVQIENVNAYFNGGYGIMLDVSFGVLESTHLLNVDGDGNVLGNVGVLEMGSTATASDKNSSVLVVTALRGEQRQNPNAFASGAIGTQSLMVFDGCNSGTVVVNGMRHQSIVTSDKPGDSIVVKSQTAGFSPDFIVTGATLAVKPSKGQDVSGDALGAILNDTANTISVPAGVASFRYGRNVLSSAVTPSSATKPWTLSGGSTAASAAVPSGGFQAQGATPAYVLYETDAATDEKTWAFIASGGDLTLRSLTEAGTADIALNITNTAGVVSEFQFKKATTVENAAFRFTSIPTYADNASAVSGGLATGRVYRTATGELRIVV